MKISKFVFIVIVAIVMVSCGQKSSQSSSDDATEQQQSSEVSAQQEDNVELDKMEIQRLVKTVLPNGVGFAVFPSPVADEADTYYIGFDMDEHKKNMNNLKKSNLFASEFINHLDKVVRAVDKKLRNGEEWFVGELGYFDDVDPWCNCQDRPNDNGIEITFLNIDSQKATLIWTWKDPKWSKDNPYTVRVVKENDIWKIAYLQGFDFGY